MILSLELNADCDKVEFYFDREGLTKFRQELEKIDLQVGSETAHVHLMTREWGGDELTSEIMHEGNTLINHLKLICLNA